MLGAQNLFDHIRLEFLQELRRVIKPGPDAIFYWRTDFKEYNETAQEEFKSTGFMECIDSDAEPAGGVMTNFETKYIKEGRPIYRSNWCFTHN